MPVTAAIRRRLNSTDEGFTLVELSVAMFVTLLVVAALAAAFLSSIKGIALAKQRQAATGLATATMEQFRAIDYATLSSGMTCSDVSSDSRITLSGGCTAGVTGTFAPGFGGISEPVVLQTSGPTAAPLNPHKSTKAIENVTYTIASYVTSPTVASQSFNVTVIVSWSSSVTRVTKQIVQRSVAFSPSRCLSSATHPYAGACQAEFNGDAGLSKAGMTVVNADDGVSPIPGFGTLTKLDLDWANLSSTMNAEQITTLTGLAGATGVTMTSAGIPTATGNVSATTSADSDPASASGGISTATLSQGSTSTLYAFGTGGTLGMNPTTTDSGSLDARTSSTVGSCLDASNAALVATGLPCAWGSTQPSGSASQLTLNLPNSAPNWTLASYGPSSSAARSTVARIGTSGGTACPTTTTPGCITSQASRALGTVTLGGLPTAQAGDTAPTGWGGSMISVSGLTESAYAEAGPGHRNPTFTRSAGTVSYYDASTGTIKTVPSFTTRTSDFTADLGTATGTYFKGSHTTVVKLSGTLTAGSVTPTAPSISIPDATCKSSSCAYSATTPSALTATLVYDISIDGAQVTRFAVKIDLGALVARASYKAAFDA